MIINFTILNPFMSEGAQKRPYQFDEIPFRQEKMPWKIYQEEMLIEPLSTTFLQIFLKCTFNSRDICKGITYADDFCLDLHA